MRISGQFEAQEKASRVIRVMSVLSLAAMLLILYTHFRSVRLATLVLVSRPIAFIGAVMLVVATGQVVSIATLVGMIALLGVSTRVLPAPGLRHCGQPAPSPESKSSSRSRPIGEPRR